MGSSVAAQTDPTSCSVSYDNQPATPATGNADADMSATFSLTSLSFTGHARGFVTGSATALASADGTASLLLDTPGPVRPGFITFTELLLPFPGPPPIGETAQISIGPYSGHCAAGSCGGDLAPRLGHTYATLPFTLGEEYLFSGAFHAQAGVTSSTSIEFGNGGTIDFSYFLTDADGNVVEPFEVAVPEPTSVILCGLGACLLAFWQSGESFYPRSSNSSLMRLS